MASDERKLDQDERKLDQTETRVHDEAYERRKLYWRIEKALATISRYQFPSSPWFDVLLNAVIEIAEKLRAQKRDAEAGDLLYYYFFIYDLERDAPVPFRNATHLRSREFLNELSVDTVAMLCRIIDRERVRMRRSPPLPTTNIDLPDLEAIELDEIPLRSSWLQQLQLVIRNHLDEDDQHLLRMRMSGMTFSEVADSMGLSRIVVSRRWRELLTLLTSHMEDYI